MSEIDNKKEVCADNWRDCECSNDSEDFSKFNLVSSYIVVTKSPTLQYKKSEYDTDSE